ncbi:cytochrome b5 [Platysternon megacephalum]|uniref:Cytochrome b5 n=1 Tax=Platysternon megacephalum TaxID=55544 RepID=A0A4D9EQQ0_9SAUR|nr:cytochrome b5 [Platysternon megacephalum]
MHDPWLTDRPQTRRNIQVSGGKATSQDWSNQEIIVIHQLWQHQPDEIGQGVNQVEVKDLLIHNHTHPHCLEKDKGPQDVLPEREGQAMERRLQNEKMLIWKKRKKEIEQTDVQVQKHHVEQMMLHTSWEQKSCMKGHFVTECMTGL